MYELGVGVRVDVVARYWYSSVNNCSLVHVVERVARHRVTIVAVHVVTGLRVLQRHSHSHNRSEMRALV